MGEFNISRNSAYIPFEDYQRDVNALVEQDHKCSITRTTSVPNIREPMITASQVAVPGGFRREYQYARRIQDAPLLRISSDADFEESYTQPLLSSIAAHINATMQFVTGLEDDSDIGLFEDVTTKELLLRQRQREPVKCSVGKTCLSIFKSFIAVGILFLPNAFHYAGWFVSSLMLLCSGCISLLGMLKLSRCHQRTRVQYSDIGRLAYGNWMYALISFSLAFSQFCFCTSAMIFIEQTVDNFCNHFGIERPSVISIYGAQLCILCPLGWIRKISAMKYTNLLGDCFIVIAVVYVISCGIDVIRKNGYAPTSHAYTTAWGAVPFIGTSVYAFEGIALIIPIRESMEKPEHFSKVITLMIALMAVLLGGIAVTGNLAWGEATPPVALNAPKMSPSLLLVQLGYIIAICCSFPMVVYPCYTIVEEQLFYNMKKSTRRTTLKNITRTGLCVLMSLLAIVGGQDLELFISFVGTFCSIPLAFIFPGLLHYKLYQGSSWKSDFFLIAVGAVLMPLTFLVDCQSALGM